MNRNVESRFALAPSASIGRSRFKIPYRRLSSFNVGQIVPFYMQEVLPGDTFKIDTTKVVRMQTLVAPVMDNLYLDTYYFFVPNRLVWSHWKEFMGENTQSAWLPATTYTIPQVTSPASTGWNVGTLADYMGLPTGVAGLSVSALPFRAYAKIINEFFRDENLQDPLNIPMDETTVVGVNTGTFVTDVVKGGIPYNAAKYHDYFTSALPAPQKGPDVPIPAVAGTAASIPVYGNGKTIGLMNGSSYGGLAYSNPAGYAAGSPLGFYSGKAGSDINTSDAASGAGNVTGLFGALTKAAASSNPADTGLIADTSALGISLGSINQLRLAFQIQKFYEKDARGGTRYIEILKSHFGVTSPDARLQRPEYLGGNRIPLNISQVAQTSGTASGSTPQGNTAAFSLTSDSHSDFTRSFTEHGYVFGLMVARYHHVYQQGIERSWSRKDRFDFYDPIFANIGEQALLNKEIYAQGSSVVDSDGNPYDEQVFGYQEAWADYRYKPSQVTGEMRSQYSTSLDVWHWADDYNALPSLSDSWIQEDKGNIDRSLAVTSSVSNQLIADIFVQNVATRPMPTYSIPGLIDHH